MDLGVIVQSEAVQGPYGDSVFHDPIIDLLHRQVGMGHQIPFAPEVSSQGVSPVLEVFKRKQLAFFIRQQGLELRFRDHILAGDLESVHLDLQGIRQFQFGPFCFFDGDLTGGRGGPLGFRPGPVPCLVLEHGSITLPFPDSPKGCCVFLTGCGSCYSSGQHAQAQGNGGPDQWI